ncbi:hypothetical protein C2G38_2175562 [Gigaspora rosea]|uniref:TLDc domain-containing protein n=1 Tax=Gigaspora rosea TaxID=44941 RepID=A0A397VRT5_9GLOM|nr:hypothetical protein C2G38_2175562 [Gigaspora rosea]
MTRAVTQITRSPGSIILPPRSVLKLKLLTKITELFSLIISEAHATKIASWIDKKKTNSITNNPYGIKLTLYGTRDGFTANSFWKLCDKQRHLIIIMKIKGTDEILGRYNTIGWVKPTTGGVEN